jgi:hypothetical protein
MTSGEVGIFPGMCTMCFDVRRKMMILVFSPVNFVELTVRYSLFGTLTLMSVRLCAMFLQHGKQEVSDAWYDLVLRLLVPRHYDWS